MRSALPSLLNLQVSCKYEESILPFLSVSTSLPQMSAQCSFLSTLFEAITASRLLTTLANVLLNFCAEAITLSLVECILEPSEKCNSTLSANISLAALRSPLSQAFQRAKSVSAFFGSSFSKLEE